MKNLPLKKTFLSLLAATAFISETSAFARTVDVSATRAYSGSGGCGEENIYQYNANIACEEKVQKIQERFSNLFINLESVDIEDRWHKINTNPVTRKGTCQGLVKVRCTLELIDFNL